MALIEREKKTKNSKKIIKYKTQKYCQNSCWGEKKKLKITKKLQNTKSQKYNVIYASRQQYPVYLFCFFLFRGDHVKCFAAIIPIIFYAQRRTVPCIFFMRLSMREKLKIPQKKNYKNIKSENIVKLLLRRCIFFYGDYANCLAANIFNASRRTVSYIFL